MQGPHPRTQEQWREALGMVDVQLLCRWTPSSPQRCWGASGSACAAVNPLLCGAARAAQGESHEQMSVHGERSQCEHGMLLGRGS